MNIPKKLKVGGKIYKVNITNNITLGDDYTGEILYNDLVINIRPQAEQKMEADFLHEMVHAIYYQRGIHAHNEDDVDSMAHALYMVMQDNPAMFAPKKKGQRRKDSK